ncbi:MAG: GNAT family N-acetyltransferase [Ruminococcaceae bacterium]|nr:GNAT family N-acetyltransferase [Oscillospiraceae bacterium]
MTIKSERLVLRPLCSKDIETVHEYTSDIENTKYMVYLPNITEQETQNFLSSVEQEWKKKQPGFYEFAIVLDGLQIGHISIYLTKIPNEGRLGWIINKKFWNHGYASEAATALLSFAKTKLHLEKVIAHCDGRNAASQRVMEKIGMSLMDANGTRTYKKREETAQELTYMVEL